MLENQSEMFIFKSFGFFEVSRDSVKFIKENNLSSDPETILANATPFGIPFENVFKISIINNEIYFSYLKFDLGIDKGEGVIIKLTEEFLEKFPTSVLVENIDGLFSNGKNLNEIKIFIKEGKAEEIDPNIPNLDGIVFTLLVGAPLYILTDQRNILTYFKRFQDLFPLKVSNKATVVSYSNSFTENVSMIGMHPTTTNLSALEKQRSITNTIWYIEKGKVFATFTSNLTQRWAKLLDQNKDLEFKTELLEFCNKIEVNSQLETVQDVIDELNFTLNDAQLFIGLKNLLQGKRKDITEINEW
jgi:hypothetical protein